MTVFTDPRRRAFARKELCPMTTQTILVFRILSDVRKSVVALANLFPIRRRKSMARLAGKFLLHHMTAVRELRIINLPRLRPLPRRHTNDHHQRQNPPTILSTHFLCFLCLFVAVPLVPFCGPIRGGRSRAAMTYKAGAHDSFAVLDQPACSRCSCSIDNQCSSQAVDAP